MTSSGFLDHARDPRRIAHRHDARWDVAGDHCAGTHHGVGTDGDSGQDDCSSAEAIEACSLQVLNKRDFNELRQRHPSVELVLIGILRSQVIRLTSQLVDTLTEDARTKVLRTLCRLAEVFKVADGNRIRITHERLKTMAGVTRKVTDILNEIEIKGLIKRERGHAFYVPDLQALRAEAGLPPTR